MQKITGFGKNDIYSLLTLCSVKRRWGPINLKSLLVFFFDWLSGFSLFEFVDHTLNFLHMWFQWGGYFNENRIDFGLFEFVYPWHSESGDPSVKTDCELEKIARNDRDWRFIKALK